MEKKRDSREVTIAARSQVRPEYAAMYGIPDYYELSGAEISRKVMPMVETAAAHIGVEEQAYGPPGCSRPRMNLNSGGNERFYSYDGQWKGGRLGGFGKCVACALRNHCCCSACPRGTQHHYYCCCVLRLLLSHAAPTTPTLPPL